ncbi:MAG TPA: hypothetical protein VFG83_15320, partial [Kofleriaceae bacterium]|nr:hypothetical protein [Kofleriaceae bacterium]
MKHALIVTALVSLCACSGVTKVGEQPSWRDQGGTGEAPEGPLVLVPQSPRPGYYNAQKRGVVPESETFDAIEEAVAKAAAEAEIPAPDKDPRLYQACADLAAAVRPDDPMPYDMIATALHWHGIVEPSPHVVIAVGDSGDTGAILEKLAPELPALLASGRIARMGIGKSERDDGQAVTVLAFQESFIDLKPVPRKVPVGATIALQGVVKAPYTQPEVYVTEATGKVKTLPLVRFDGGGFRARATCGSELGRMQIEIAAGDATGSAVLANFPVWCGTEPPERVTAAAADDHRDPPATEAEAATRLLALINGARKKQGLQPLVADP